MDGERFDGLTKALGRTHGRRGLIAGLAAGALGGLAAGEAAAGNRRWVCVCNASGDRCRSRKLPGRRGRAKVRTGLAQYGKCPIPSHGDCPFGRCDCGGGTGTGDYVQCGSACHCDCGNPDATGGGFCMPNPVCGGRCRSCADCHGLSEGPCHCVFDMDDTVGTCRPVPIDHGADAEGTLVR
jgi:hypothetical protein